MTTALVDIIGASGMEVRPRIPRQPRVPVVVRASYDAAQTTSENTNHWGRADDYSAAAALSPDVRYTLRKRSRYEVANNTYAKGILRTLADYVVGTGPRLQVLTKDREFNRAVEHEFSEWANETSFARKLWLLRFAQSQDGEAFCLWFDNRGLPGQVKLDLAPVEADRVADPTLGSILATGGDGIIYDDYGNPIAYRVLRRHPGDLFGVIGSPEFDTIQSKFMAHLFRAERAGQLRGVPEITPALPLFALLRRFTLATVAAAETAASLAGVIRTQQAPEDPDTINPLEEIDLPYRNLLTLPGGYDITQMRAEHPAQTYEGFKRALLSEIARCLSMPFNIAAADSSTYNFASGKLDYSTFFKSVGIDQAHMEATVADPTLAHWYREVGTFPDTLPEAPDNLEPGELPHTWNWDGQELLDPREAAAKETGLAAGIETYPAIFGRRGLDFESEHEAQAAALDMTLAEYRAALRNKLFGLAPAASTARQSATGEPMPVSPDESGDVEDEQDA